MKVYIACPIRGARGDPRTYQAMASAIRQAGHEVLNDFIAATDILGQEVGLTDVDIFERDLALLNIADAIVAEVSGPSLGVGYELGLMRAWKRPILCVWQNWE